MTIVRAALAAALALVVALTSGPAWGQGLVDDFRAHLANDWEQIKRAWWTGGWTVYVSGYSWHPPWSYSAADTHNDAAWGGGFGRYVYDDDKNYHGLYGLAFLDSYRNPMYLAGYTWQTYWGSGDFKVGLGYTVFLFGRSDAAHLLGRSDGFGYVPLPGILPLLSLRYTRFELLGTYVPPLGTTRGTAFIFGRLNF